MLSLLWIFPEDEEVSVGQLIWLWIAEGFVLKTELKSLEDVATNYMMDLVRKSLIIVSKKGSMGEVKTCRIHDLLHEFCMTKAQKKNFFQLLRGNDEILGFNEPCHLPFTPGEDLKKLRLFSHDIHSLLFFTLETNNIIEDLSRDVSFIILVLKHPRVLDIRQVNLGKVFPSEIELLVQLRYLVVTCHLYDIPSLIGKLSNLQTFMLDSIGVVTLLDTIWNLHKLRHLWAQAGFCFPIADLENSSNLYELKSCSIGIIYSEDTCEKLMRKFPMIRKLKCKLLPDLNIENLKDEDVENENNILLILNCLVELKSLHVMGEWLRARLPVSFNFPPNLTKLTLHQVQLPQSEMSNIGKLPHLEVLKLLAVDFCGGILEMVEGDFSNLKFLKLTHSRIVCWIASDDQFPSLEKLILEGCEKLEEVPSCLENISTLETIEVKYCSQFVESQVKQIQNVRTEMGDSALKIILIS